MIAIVDYGMGNLHSVLKAFKRAGSRAEIISDAKKLENASKIVLPGVGNFKKGMQALKEKGFAEIILKKAEDQTPILGICLGMQLLTSHSEEGNCDGLNLIEGRTERFTSAQVKIPHIGWNTIKAKKEDRLVGEIDDEELYFVHSYKVQVKNSDNEIATTEYGEKFASVINKNNIWGMQFHPEKSHKIGIQIIRKFSQI